MELYWIGIRKDVGGWCRECENVRKVPPPPKRAGALLQVHRVGRPVDQREVDVSGTFLTTLGGIGLWSLPWTTLLSD